ncbi:amidase family protein [Achromobacter agilis]|uniref:Acylamidase n=1 Tax=Achromobacter agilis TaxID=1353888 RepID=A0A446CGV5_9BURK|nr:amidase family protein [Achromobacter agilis]SSW67100.1 Acylamidase [Achromobacter agilis]
MTNELWRWSALDLAKAIRTRDVSSREAVQSCLERAALLNPRFNPLSEIHADQAIKAADAADAAVREGRELGLLHGVPVTIKANADLAGSATTNGVVAYRDVIARENNPAVDNWIKAGAVVIGRTNVPAFSWRWFTDNDLHGRTVNPFDAARTPGGSSGGAAVAAALGIGALAHGSDQGGSIRYPAYACGVAGLRPSQGRVPAYNASQRSERPVASQMAATQGPMGRTIADLRLGLAAMSSGDSRDPWWVPAPLDLRQPGESRRVALFRGPPAFQPDPAVLDALQRSAAWLEEAGYIVEEAEPPRFGEAAALWLEVLMNEASGSMQREIERAGDRAIQRAYRSMLAHTPVLEKDGFVNAMAMRTTILREWGEFFNRFPVLLMPVSLERPFLVDQDQQGDAAMAGMLRAQSPLVSTAVLGLPGLSVPVGLADGVPMGVQLVAGRFREDLCLAAGEALEARAAWSVLDRCPV